MSQLAIVDMTQDEAREFIAYVRNQQRELPQRIRDAWKRRAWMALGYPTWDAMCVAERIQLRGLPRDERQEIVLDLRSAGMSTRAIGSALGVHNTTVRDDLSSAGKPADEPGTVTSLDGRERPAARPPQMFGCPHPFPNGGPVDRCPSCGGERTELVDPLPAPVAEQIEARIAGRITRPAPPRMTAEELAEHEEGVRRVQDIAAAHRQAKTIVMEVQSMVVTVVTGSRYGETGLVSEDMIRQLRKAIDLLEGEL